MTPFPGRPMVARPIGNKLPDAARISLPRTRRRIWKTIVGPLGKPMKVLVRKEVSRLLTKNTSNKRTSKEKKSCLLPDKVARVHLIMARPVRSEEVVGSVQSRSGGGEYKLHIVMDKASFMRLRWLKAQLEASTEAEVVRRALKAYEIFEPDDEMTGDHVGPNSDDLVSGNGEELYIRIPDRMKAYLDIKHGDSGLSYGEQVRQALRVLTQLTIELLNCKEKLATAEPISSEKGATNARRRLILAAAC